MGVRVFDLLEALNRSLDQILVSDVGKPFNIVRSHSLGMIGRSMRATDILWDRVGQLEQHCWEGEYDMGTRIRPVGRADRSAVLMINLQSSRRGAGFLSPAGAIRYLTG